MTEVYINGSLVDIDEDEVVTASYGNVSFGEMQKRKGVRSNTWALPLTQRNKDVYESCEVQGSYSLVPYRKATISVHVHGVPVFDGFCIIKSAKDNYDIQSFAGATDFYSTINNKKLTQLDLSTYDHLWWEADIVASWSNTQGYIYAFLYNGKYQATDFTPPDGLLPHMFFHTVVKQIAIDAGYTLSGLVLTNPRFLRHMILVNKFPLPISYGGTFQLASILPDMSQSKIWLDFANMYGLQFDIDEVNKTIQADYIDDILFNDPEEWTGKIDQSERVETTYSLDYGQKSFLRFLSDDICTQDYAKEIVIDDTTLDPEKDVYKSSFFLAQFLGSNSSFLEGLAGTYTFTLKPEETPPRTWDAVANYNSVSIVKQSVWWNGTFYRAIADSINQQPPNATYWKVIQEKDLWDVRSRPMYGYLSTEPGSTVRVLFTAGYVPVTKVINHTQLDWTNTYSNHYRVFSRIIQRTKKVETLVKLSYADVSQLNFTRAKRIDNELYVLEEVKQYKLNRLDSTITSLIRI